MELKDCYIGKIVHDIDKGLFCYIEGLSYNSLGEVIIKVRYPYLEERSYRKNPHFSLTMKEYDNKICLIHPGNLEEVE